MKTLNLIITLVVLGLPVLAQLDATSVPADPANVMKDFFDAYRTHDRAKINALIHPEVVWIQPGANRIAGVKKSRSEVLEMGQLMRQLSDKTIQLADVKILNATGNSLACLLRWKAAQPVGTILDVENIDVYTIENGLIVQVKVYSADLEQEDKFWGK